jgi:hypothetical protein
LVSLEGLDNNQAVRQVVQQFDPQTRAVIYEKVLEYSSLSRSTLIFENGAFSQGSMQLGVFSDFGAEFGFVMGDRRLRLVQLFQPEGEFARITLIREQRESSTAPERPPLTVEHLLGEWHGEATTLYPDLRSPETYKTWLRLDRQGDTLEQHLSSDTFSFTSTAQVRGSVLRFSQGSHPVQVVLLPDGASCTCPPAIPRGQNFFLEVGWLVAPDQRQRLIRQYDAQGGWSSLTLVKEQKQS